MSQIPAKHLCIPMFNRSDFEISRNVKILVFEIQFKIQGKNVFEPTCTCIIYIIKGSIHVR